MSAEMKRKPINKAELRQFATEWPELFWILCAWLVVLPLAWLRYRIDGVPYTASTVGFYLGCLGCVVIPARYLGKVAASAEIWGASRQSRSMQNTMAFWATVVAVIGIIGIFFYWRREFQGVDVSDMRGEERGMIAAGTADARAYILLSPVAMASIVFWLNQNLLLRIVSAMVFFAVFWKASLISGARFELLPIPLLGAVAICFRYSELLFKNPVRTTLAAASGLTAVVMVNSFYNILSTKGGGESLVAAYIRNSGAAVFELVGLRQVPAFLEEMMGSLAEYVFAPPIYLDFYLHENQFAPTWGTLQFSNIFVRLGLDEAMPTKLAVDDLYAAIGIYNNVWASGLREVVIDWGVAGAFVQCLGMGALLGWAKRFLATSLAARNLYLILCTYLLATPLTSLFKSRIFEASFYGAIAWLVVDLMFRRTVTRPTGPRVTVATGPIQPAFRPGATPVKT